MAAFRKLLLGVLTPVATVPALVLGLGLTPAQALSRENPAALCVEDSPASSTYFQVEFFDEAREPSTYNDPVFPGGTEGECGSANVFAEPVQYFVRTHYQTRHRYWYYPYTTATTWSAWIRDNCTAGSWWWLPGHGVNTYTKSTLTEIQILPC